eukprot:4843924-Pleurochrysis_carterae.AAC.6
MPLLASYPSRIDTSPAVDSVYRTFSAVFTAARSAVRVAIRLDATIDDAFHASLRCAPLFFYTLFTSAPSSPTLNGIAPATPMTDCATRRRRCQPQSALNCTSDRATERPPVRRPPLNRRRCLQSHGHLQLARRLC